MCSARRAPMRSQQNVCDASARTQRNQALKCATHPHARIMQPRRSAAMNAARNTTHAAACWRKGSVQRR
eukprot:15063798-Alexandrium_andersonii.AAC.1